MRCMICGRDPLKNGVALLRVNDKGRPGAWACEAHYYEGRAYYPDDDPDASRQDHYTAKALGQATACQRCGFMHIAGLPCNTRTGS